MDVSFEIKGVATTTKGGNVDVVQAIEFTMWGVHGDRVALQEGLIYVAYDPAADFKPYDQLTQEDFFRWIADQFNVWAAADIMQQKLTSNVVNLPFVQTPIRPAHLQLAYDADAQE